MNNVTDAILRAWTGSRKTRVSPKGWVHGNAPCCVHNGETKDTRGRGGFKVDSTTGGIVYHCFNCNFKTGFTPGKKLYHKTRRLLSWIGIDENEINRLTIEALRIRDLTPHIFEEREEEREEITFKERPLPEGAMSFEQWAEWYALKDENYPIGLMNAVEYAAERDIVDQTDLYYTLGRAHGDNKIAAMNKRLIIPFTWKGKIVGFTARAIDTVTSVKPKYLMEVDSDYVFNTDNLIKDSKFVLVFEGPMDALLMNGVAILSNSISPEQADLIEDLGKQVIVVPDLEASGIPMIEDAIEYGWSVSFPDWEEDVKDAGEAVQRYGKLFTLKSIISNVLSTKLKIKLHMKKLNG